MSGAFCASSAIRCSFVETFAGLGVPCICPSSSSVARLPLPSTGSLGSVPPLRGYYEQLRRPVSLPAALRFPSLGGTVAALAFAPHHLERAVMGPGLLARGR